MVSEAMKAISDFSSLIIDYAAILTATSILSMALVEAAKGIVNGKAWFHRWALKKWIEREISQVDLDCLKQIKGNLSVQRKELIQLLQTKGPNLSTQFLHDIEHYCSGIRPTENRIRPFIRLYDHCAFYSLTADMLVAKLQRVFDSVIKNPDQCPHLFFLLCASQPKHVSGWLRARNQAKKKDQATTLEEKALQHHRGINDDAK